MFANLLQHDHRIHSPFWVRHTVVVKIDHRLIFPRKNISFIFLMYDLQRKAYIMVWWEYTKIKINE